MKNGIVVITAVIILAFSGLALANRMGNGGGCCGGGAHHVCSMHHDQH